MRKCTNCGKTYEKSEKFCNECGSATEEMKRFCENCGNEMPFDSLFCSNCGTKVSEPMEFDTVHSNVLHGETTMQKIKTGFAGMFRSVVGFFKNCISPIQQATSKYKIPKYVVPVVAIILVVSLLIGIVLSAVNILTPNEYVFFYSGEKLMEYNFKDQCVRTVGKSIMEHDEEDGDEGWHYSELSDLTKVSDTSNRIFYPNNYGSDGSFTLYVKYTNKTDDNGIKIDSDVTSYDITIEGSKVVYKKGTNHILYVNDIKKDKVGERKKIASDVAKYYYNDDFTSFVWKTDDGVWYSQKGDSDKIKIADDTATDVYVSNSLDIMYLQDDVLYWRPFNKEKKKIASDVNSFESENGDIYFQKKGTSIDCFYDFIDDDLFDKDSSFKKPVEPSYWDYYDYDEYQEDYQKYSKAYQNYIEKTARDQLREEWKEHLDDSMRVGKLYRYDGKKEKLIDDNVAFFDPDQNSKRVVYCVINFDNVKLKFSDIWKLIMDYISNNSDEESLTSAITVEYYRKLLENLQVRYAIDGGKPVDIDLSSNYVFDNNGILYYRKLDLDEKEFYNTLVESFSSEEKYQNNTQGTLMSIDTNKKNATGKVYAEDVNSIGIINGSHICYSSDYNTEKHCYTLSVDGQHVDDDVSKVCVIGNELYYFTDWSTESECGTLKKYESKGKSTLIAEDVHSFAKHGEKLVYLADYSSESGDLYYYKNKTDKVLLAESVGYIRGEYDGAPDGSVL